MTRKKRYSAEFKREALRRANENGVTDTLVAEELGFSTRQLRRWRDEAKKDGVNAFPGHGNARDKEMMLLKRKLAKTEDVFDYIERFYNRKRRHGYVGNISPVLFEKRTLGLNSTVHQT